MVCLGSHYQRYCEQNSNLFETLNTALYKHMNGRMADTLLYIDGLKKGISRNFPVALPQGHCQILPALPPKARLNC